MERITTTDAVFNTARELPENYIVRDHVDNEFIEALSKNTHIVVHGSSKQGKTSLRKKHFIEGDYICITCQNNWTLCDIHEAILKKVGYQVSTSQSVTIKGAHKINLTYKVGQFTAGTEVSAEHAKQINKKGMELDAGNVNEIVEALNEISFKRYIILEDFHYLNENTQIDFSVALKAFLEDSDFSFIIIGVWLEEDRLTIHNGDLAGRIHSINADKWLDSDFDQLFEASEALLHIRFDDEFKKLVKKYSNGSIFLVQKICELACKKEKVYQTQINVVEVGKSFEVRSEIKKILESESGRYTKFLMDFSSGFAATDLDLYKWIIYALIEEEKKYLELGLTAQAMLRTIRKKHPKSSSVSINKLLGALSKSVDLQSDKKIKPIVFEYDKNRSRVKIVDKRFLLWREFQEKNELYELIDINEELKGTNTQIGS